MSYVVLDGYVVRRETSLAIGICKASIPIGAERNLQWVPRSQCESGEAAEVGDRDIVVAEWFADKEGLDY